MRTFRDYLESLPSELLASVTADYVWLATLDLGPDYAARRDCCRDECIGRGMARMYAEAEDQAYDVILSNARPSRSHM